METIDLIIKIAALITAVATCFALVKQIHRAVKWVEHLAQQCDENVLSILRLTIVSTEMPMSERIAAGDKYIKLNGNGAVKHLYQRLVEENAKDEKI
mgnify:FL=1